MIGLCFSLFLMSWDGEKSIPVEPLPPVPDYTDSTQWYIVDRQGDADLFYVISTETGDHMIGDDTCQVSWPPSSLGCQRW